MIWSRKIAQDRLTTKPIFLFKKNPLISKLGLGFFLGVRGLRFWEAAEVPDMKLQSSGRWARLRWARLPYEVAKVL